MPLKIVDEGATKVAAVMFGADAKQTSWTLRLITKATAGSADPTLADSDVVGTHTVANGGGYSSITLNPSGGASPAATISVVGGIAQAAWAEQTFTFTGALTGNTTICGVQIISGSVLIAEEITTPFTPANNGDTYKVTPVIKFGNGTPT